MVQGIHTHAIPRFVHVRRVPTRYCLILPLSLMKRCQCVVVGAAPGILTVAVTDPENRLLLTMLHNLTGLSIFPVLVEERRMRLLLIRLERTLRRRLNYPLRGSIALAEVSIKQAT